ncbi:MAG: cytochrome C [Rhodobacteraceae bacterium CG17_big_fil_post_rev_8_21_14_2_50_65_11]|nr:MAG: cytochrome C [Rhodobacteraceae bacterium CG17_big_fil_post_rev_8_21_14_2_50_65_11]
MIRKLTFATALLSAPMAFADSHGGGPSGDPVAGEAAFRPCVACHVVRDPSGEVLAGRNGRTGPNLYGIAGRDAGSIEDFRYSTLMQAAAAQGLVWTEETFAAYVPNATDFLTEFSGERGRSAMTPQRVSEEDTMNLYAFLAQFGEEEMDAGASE